MMRCGVTVCWGVVVVAIIVASCGPFRSIVWLIEGWCVGGSGLP